MSLATSVTVVVVAAGAGAAAGSFAGVVADRGWRGSLAGRSRCTACGRDLRWWELVPILSYLALRGRCRVCRARIAARLLAVELIGGLLGALGAGLALLALR